jgi:CRISPR type III-associated protein (TIGR04423 family)
MFTKIESLSNIPQLKYEGYIWASDCSEPVVYSNEIIDFCSFIQNANPFIQEGYMFAENEKKSISIKHFDGIGYVIVEYDTTVLNNDNSTELNYIADPAIVRAGKNIKKLKFIRFWKLEKDELCESMEVLKPANAVFLGFEHGGNR